MATIVTDELKKEISMAGIDAFLEKPLSVASIDHILFEINKGIFNQNKTGDKQ